MKQVMIGLMVSGLFVGGCKSEIDNKTAATVNDPATTAAQTAAQTGAQTAAQAEAKPAAGDAKEASFVADGSSVEWVAAKVTRDHKGGFKDVTGKGWVDASGSLTKVEFEVDNASVFSDNDRLTGHLKSPDFFDVATHPKSTFVSTAITAAAGEGKTHDVTGDLNLHGVTKSITFPATIAAEGNDIVASTEFTLKRFDFNIEYKGAPDDLIKEDVLMKIKLKFAKPQ